MTPDRWREVETVLRELAGLAPADQAAELAKIGDPRVRTQAEKLPAADPLSYQRGVALELSNLADAAALPSYVNLADRASAEAHHRRGIGILEKLAQATTRTYWRARTWCSSCTVWARSSRMAASPVRKQHSAVRSRPQPAWGRLPIARTFGPSLP